ncbi:hypothetical protein EDB19DRAFT_1645319, partial [Suillus lakei]
LRLGADGAQGDDTSKLKTLVSEWVNHKFKPDHPINPDDKHSHGFTNDACGRLLCPAENDWNDPVIRAGIRDRSEGYIVTDLSFPAFLYNKYTANPDDLGYKAVFMSPSSAKDIKGDVARKSSAGVKVKKHVAQIIKMRKVTPCSTTYIACQVRFTLSSVTSWRSINGDFDYTVAQKTVHMFALF